MQLAHDTYFNLASFCFDFCLIIKKIVYLKDNLLKINIEGGCDLKDPSPKDILNLIFKLI